MLRPLFDVFAVTEEQLTKKAIDRLRLASCFSFFFFPVVTIMQQSNISGVMFMTLGVLSLIGLFSFAYVALSRAGNRLWVPNKYLDEGEVQRKQVSAYHTYTFVMLGMCVILLFFVIADRLYDLRALSVSVDKIIFYAIGNFVMCGISLQTFFATKLMQPLDAENEGGALVKSGADMWYKYVACGFVLLALILPLMLGPFGEHLIGGFKGTH